MRRITSTRTPPITARTISRTAGSMTPMISWAMLPPIARSALAAPDMMNR